VEIRNSNPTPNREIVSIVVIKKWNDLGTYKMRTSPFQIPLKRTASITTKQGKERKGPGEMTGNFADPHGLSTLQEEGEETDFPEGGLMAWSVVLGAWCAMIPSMGLLNSLGILHAWTSTHQLKGYSESSIGWIFGAYGFFLYFAGAQTGQSFYFVLS
jgi:hypothetical protein